MTRRCLAVVRPLLRDVLRLPQQRGIGRSVDADAAAWGAAVVANGGTYSAATLAAVSAFCISAKASNYWSKLNRINLFCGDQLAAALVPLKVGGGSATETNVNFVSGDYTEATGLTGNGSTKYLRTGLIPSVSLTLGDQHWAAYNRSSATSGATASVVMGAFDAVNRIEIDLPYTDGLAYVQITGATLFSVNPAEPYGFMLATRTAPTASVLYRNAVSIATNAAVSTALPTVEAYVFGMNNNGAVAFPGAAPCGGYSVGLGLTAADVAAYNTHMEAFQDALGRGVQ